MQNDYTTELIQTAAAMMQSGKGILAIDESHGTCEKRFVGLNIPFNEQTRHEYRHLLVSCPEIEKYVSGMILFDETIRQKDENGKSFAEILEGKGILPGIKVDKGAKQLALSSDEKVTEGLDGLRERLAEYKELGAKFAKWRAVIKIDNGLPTFGCIKANCHALARYAALCQEQGIVPMVEPEVLIDGDHSLELCYGVTEQVLKMLMSELYDQNVLLEGTILKTSMVISGKSNANRASAEDVAAATLDCLYNACPPALGGIVFLSGGQAEVEACEHLNLINKDMSHPWGISFSYGRAIQQPCLNSWAGKSENRETAQKNLLHRAKMCAAAEQGAWEKSMEE